MRKVVLALLVFGLGVLVPRAEARRWKPRFPNRMFKRGMIKAVRVMKQSSSFALRWKSISGRTIDYRVVRPQAGLKVHLKKAAANGLYYVAVGEYRYRGKKKSVVFLDNLYLLKRRERAMRVVKFDGFIPLFYATILPSSPKEKPLQYEVRGNQQSHWKYRGNKFVCLLGTWFDIHNRKFGMVYQVKGIRGRSLFFFKKRWRKPHDWRFIENYDLRRKAFLKALARRRKGLPPIRKPWVIPSMPAQRQAKYQKQCDARLSAVEKRWKVPVLVQRFPKVLPPKQPVVRKAPVSRPTSRPVPTTKPAKRAAPVKAPVAPTTRTAAARRAAPALRNTAPKAPSARRKTIVAPTTRPATPRKAAAPARRLPAKAPAARKVTK